MRAALVALAFCACSESMILTRPAELAAAVGKTVTLRGTVENSKIATLCGADVDSDSPDLRGQPAEATGVLEREVVTQAELDAAIAEKGQFANRGAGTFYRLIDPRTHALARVRRP
jgi:hypothetical protein